MSGPGFIVRCDDHSHNALTRVLAAHVQRGHPDYPLPEGRQPFESWSLSELTELHSELHWGEYLLGVQ